MVRGISSWRLMTAMAALALVLAPAAWATDGTVLITQATASHGLPGCPVTGFPIVICQPGSYRLASNIEAPGASEVIQIDASNVGLDLNNFTVSGQGALYGIHGGLVTNDVTVENGSIAGVATGMALTGNGIRVDSVRISAVTANGILILGTGMVTRCIVFGQPGAGLGILLSFNPGVSGNGGPSAVIDNLVTGFHNGLAFDKTGGYGGNTLIGNTFDVFAGESMGNNVCDSAAPC